MGAEYGSLVPVLKENNMNIRITEDYRLTSDAYNFIVEKRSITGPDSKKIAPGTEKWKQLSSHPTIELACKGLLRHKLLDSDAQSLKELIEVHTATQAAIEASVGCLS